MSDLNCPYCDAENSVNHDDGAGYQEDVLHEMQCTDCKKYFTFTTGILYVYEPYQADCLNDGEHKWQSNSCCPTEYTRMHCTDCEERRDPTLGEWFLIFAGKLTPEETIKHLQKTRGLFKIVSQEEASNGNN